MDGSRSGPKRRTIGFAEETFGLRKSPTAPMTTCYPERRGWLSDRTVSCRNIARTQATRIAGGCRTQNPVDRLRTKFFTGRTAGESAHNLDLKGRRCCFMKWTSFYSAVIACVAMVGSADAGIFNRGGNCCGAEKSCGGSDPSSGLLPAGDLPPDDPQSVHVSTELLQTRLRHIRPGLLDRSRGVRSSGLCSRGGRLCGSGGVRPDRLCSGSRRVCGSLWPEGLRSGSRRLRRSRRPSERHLRNDRRLLRKAGQDDLLRCRSL